MTQVIDYTPPQTVRAFILDHKPGELFYDWIIGPVGSGKTTGIFFKLIYMAGLQAPSPDGVRRSRAVVVRNTMPQLRDTTIASWNMWFKDGEAGAWIATRNTFILRFGDVECEVLFRPLDTPEDVARVLSLEVTFALLDEFVNIPQQIVDALSARVGRYPGAKDGGPTNWGIWGSSNTDTEDNWWFDYLHDEAVVMRVPRALVKTLADQDAATAYRTMTGDPRNVKFFSQPSGFTAEAENLPYLPGGAGYYTNQAKGKPEAWIKQFIEVEWGFSVSGKPVMPAFKPALHMSPGVKWNPALPLVVGLDPGLGGTAAVLGQEDAFGRLLVLGEVVSEGVGARRFIAELFKPYIRRHFPDAEIVIAPDPAAANRAQTDEKTVGEEWSRHFKCRIESNNRLPLRLDALEHYMTKLSDVGPAFLVDQARCPIVTRALKGGWRYAVSARKDMIASPEPEKNKYSHPGDAVGYLARYFHRQGERDARYKGAKPFKPPRSFAPVYHFR